MKTKKQIECECGKMIIGFSEHHAKQNLELHKITSREHKERMLLLKNPLSKINLKGLNVADILEFHPLIREDICEIGRYQ